MAHHIFVLNLVTGEQKIYSTDPVTAVKEAYADEYDLRNRINRVKLPLVEGKRIVSCGHWTAKKVES